MPEPTSLQPLPADHPTAAEVAHAWAPFELWVRAAQASSRKRKLSQDSADKYRSIWSGYLQWLAGTNTNWRDARASDISAFLQSLVSRPRRGPQRTTSSASPVTQRRYWRILRDVYSHAVIANVRTDNPCSEAGDVPASEAMASMVLPPWVIDHLHDAVLRARQENPDQEWQDLRNDTLVLLLCHTGLKAGEIQRLRVDQLHQVKSGRQRRHVVVKLDGQRKSQAREIPLYDPQLLAVLQRWLHERSDFENPPPWLFFGRKFRPGTTERTPLSTKSIFLIVNQAITRHLGANTFDFPLAHAGPEALRNTVIAKWLGQGKPIDEVMGLSGLAETRALMRLMPDTTEAASP